MRTTIVFALCALLAPNLASAQEEEEDQDMPEFGPGEDEKKKERVEDNPLRGPADSSDSDTRVGTPVATVAETATDNHNSDDELNIEVFGALRLLGAYVQDDPQVSYVGRNDGFRLQNASLGIDAQWTEKVRVRLSTEGARDERDSPNDTEGTLRFAIKDAYADIDLHPKVTLRIARFLPLFELDESSPTEERRFVRRSLASRGVFATDGYEAPGFALRRNLGLALRSEKALKVGSSSFLGYELAAQNGNGEFDSANDNDALAFSGALILRGAPYLYAFAAARYNKRTEGELPFRATETDIGASGALVLTFGSVRLAGQFLLNRREFPTTGGPIENSFGAHAEAVVGIPGMEYLEAGYRFAILDDSDLMPANRVQEHTLGVNLSVPEYHLRVMLNYTHPAEEAGRKLDNERVEGLVEITL